jgi:hypothetical protein
MGNLQILKDMFLENVDNIREIFMAFDYRGVDCDNYYFDNIIDSIESDFFTFIEKIAKKLEKFVFVENKEEEVYTLLYQWYLEYPFSIHVVGEWLNEKLEEVIKNDREV